MTAAESDKYYLDVAKRTAQNSRARRLQVGALIVKDRAIISDGFNGTPAGFDNNCEDTIHNYEEGICRTCQNPNPERCYICPYHSEKLVTKPEVLHAEANAITKVAKSTQSCDGATLYCTHAPCVECSKLIIQAGIRRLVYGAEYRDHRGIDLLRKANVNVELIKD